MIYLSEFVFPGYDEEYRARLDEKRTCFNTMYPFFVLSSRGLERLNFAPVTLLYGGNGSGKTTALNVIAEALSLRRDAPFNRSSFFDDYVKRCRFRTLGPLPEESRAVSSDDVFDYMLSLRAVNEGIDAKREELFDEYFERRRSGPFQMQSLDDYDELKKVTDARKKTLSGYVRAGGMDRNVREQSNGESAYFYFTSRIQGAGLYLLDEPENSLSPQKQLELKQFLEEEARFFDCQFIIATHSPFLLSLRGAKIYDFDGDPVDVKRWTELESVQTYFRFFEEHRSAFLRSRPVPDKKT